MRHALSSLLVIVVTVGAGCPRASQDPAQAPMPGLLPMDPGNAPPMVAAVEPPNFARDLEPGERTLTATFDRAMSTQGWSWVKESDDTAPQVIGSPSFSPDGLRAMLTVKLEPARMYVVWLNNATMQGFADDKGVPLLPFRWTFSTRGYHEAALAPTTQPSTQPAVPAADAPRVVQVSPPDGARDVDPATAALRVTFDRAMAPEGWSWVKENNQPFPEGAGRPSFDPSGRTNTLPVKMQPGTTYVIWINSETHQDFQDTRGVPAIPYRWSFTTRR
jgi:hypothetical protein